MIMFFPVSLFNHHYVSVITTVLAELIINFAEENRGFYFNLIIVITKSTAISFQYASYLHIIWLRLHNTMDTAIFMKIETAR